MPESHHQHAPGNPGASPAPQVPAGGYAVRLYPLDGSEELRITALWAVVWRGKWWILALSLLGATAAVVASFFMSPVYRAEVVMAPVTADRPGGGLSGLASSLGGIAAMAGINIGAADNSTAKSLAVLRSREFTQRFIERHQLLPELFADDWDASNGKWDVSDPAEIPTLWRAYQMFDTSVRTITQDEKTGIVTMSIDWWDPLAASEWANDMARDVNADIRGRAIEQSRKNIEFLRKELQSTSEVELRTAVFGLMEAEMRNAMVSNVKSEYAFEIVDPAVKPEKKIWPNRLLLAVLGFAIGLLLGVVAVFLRRAFDHDEPAID